MCLVMEGYFKLARRHWPTIYGRVVSHVAGHVGHMTGHMAGHMASHVAGHVAGHMGRPCQPSPGAGLMAWFTWPINPVLS